MPMSPTQRQEKIPLTIDCAFADCTNLTNIIISSGITKYGNEVFYNCSNLIRVCHSESVTEISFNMFKGCTLLKDLYLPSNIKNISGYAYNGCSALKNIYLPDGLEKFSNSFNDCINLESISFPESLKIKIAPFSGCPKLQSIEMRGCNSLYYSENDCLIEKETKKIIMGSISSVIPNDILIIGKNAFKERKIKTIDIKSNVKLIEDGAFYLCDKLTNLKIEGVNEIGKTAFLGCSSLTSIELRDINKINEKCFINCPFLENIDIVNVNSIGRQCFMNSSNLRKVNLESVKNLEEEVFNNCENLSEIIFSNKLENIKYFNTNGILDIVFKNHDYYIYENECVIDTRTNTLVCGTENSVIPDYIKVLGEYSFKGRKNNIVLPEGLEVIGKCAFQNCSFGTIKFPKTLRRIEESAFIDSLNLLYVIIPENIEYIGNSAFHVKNNWMSVLFDGFKGELGERAFINNSVYSDLSCKNISDAKWGPSPFSSWYSVAYNTVFKEDNNEKYVYSIDLKYVFLLEHVFYGKCYREGYKHVGWSFTENADQVDIELTDYVIELKVNYEVVGKKEAMGFISDTYLEIQKEFENTTIYAVWEKI